MKKPDIGTHIAQPCTGTLSTFGKENKPCVVVEFLIVGDPTVGDIWIGWLGDNIGKDGKSLTERTTETLRTCGWDGDDLSDIQLPEDAQVEIVVGDEEYKGQKSRKIQFVNPVGGGFRPKAMDKSAAKKLAEKLKTKVGGGGKQARPPTPPPPRDEPDFGPPGADDDIPF